LTAEIRLSGDLAESDQSIDLMMFSMMKGDGLELEKNFSSVGSGNRMAPRPIACSNL
jgi:hypothetical protein